ncbi:hypothetical protein EDB86DRAFT_2829811 [Lactarius hatsudake]|nr:hypothetical protein EDB86DRAFT_2829811 [Lactarius hatsudake]
MAITRMARVRDKGRVSGTRVTDNRDKGLEAPHSKVHGDVTSYQSRSAQSHVKHKISPGTSSSGLFWTILRRATCQGHVTAIPSGPIPKAPGSGSRAGREIDRSPRVSNTHSPPAALLQRRFLRRRKAKPLVASPTKGP